MLSAILVCVGVVLFFGTLVFFSRKRESERKSREVEAYWHCIHSVRFVLALRGYKLTNIQESKSGYCIDLRSMKTEPAWFYFNHEKGYISYHIFGHDWTVPFARIRNVVEDIQRFMPNLRTLD